RSTTSGWILSLASSTLCLLATLEASWPRAGGALAPAGGAPTVAGTCAAGCAGKPGVAGWAVLASGAGSAPPPFEPPVSAGGATARPAGQATSQRPPPR